MLNIANGGYPVSMSCKYVQELLNGIRVIVVATVTWKRVINQIVPNHDIGWMPQATGAYQIV